MPREILSTNAPMNAAGSAALRAHTDEDHSTCADESAPRAVARGASAKDLIGGAPLATARGADWAEANRVRPRFRVVAGSAPVAEPVVEDDYRPVPIRENHSGGEDRSEDWLEPREARLDSGDSRAPFLAAVESGDGEMKVRNPQNAEQAEMAERAEKPPAIRKTQSATRGRPGLKKLNKRQKLQDWPPAPRGCEWRRSEDGLNLWRCWTEWNGDKNKRIRKSRYAGHLSDDAWRVMKEYDHEAIISTIGERLRRHGGR